MSKILIINAGSATIKFKIYTQNPLAKNSLTEEVAGIAERIGLDNSFIELKENETGTFFSQKFPEGITDHREALNQIIKRLKKYLPEIHAVGHRVVHGGELFTKTSLINAQNLSALEKFNDLAPLHNPVNLTCLKEMAKLLPNAKQFAIFDTAYYTTIPDYAHLYALPIKFYRQFGIRRYGFHGISHKYAAVEGAKKAKLNINKSKIITCHLGSGASLTATKNGEAIMTTMGFTPLEGLMMSTRCGDMDPAVVIFMIKKLGLNVIEIDRILNKESGLLGVAGTMDMREILVAAGQKVLNYEVKKDFTAEQKTNSELALKMFIYNIVRYIGQMTAIMKGLDLIVFTGGIGERSPVVRQMVLKDVKHLGKFKSLVIPANEELMMAREVISINPKFKITSSK